MFSPHLKSTPQSGKRASKKSSTMWKVKSWLTCLFLITSCHYWSHIALNYLLIIRFTSRRRAVIYKATNLGDAKIDAVTSRVLSELLTAAPHQAGDEFDQNKSDTESAERLVNNTKVTWGRPHCLLGTEGGSYPASSRCVTQKQQLEGETLNPLPLQCWHPQPQGFEALISPVFTLV